MERDEKGKQGTFEGSFDLEQGDSGDLPPEGEQTVVEDRYLSELRAKLEAPPSEPVEQTTEKLEEEVRGTATAVRSDVVVVPMPGPPARGENLYVLCGANAGLNHPVRVDRITVGRGADNDLVLSDTSVSRHHLVLERTESGWSFRDLESENGTYQKGRFVRQGKLEYGAPLELGRTILVMERGALE